MQGVRYIHYLCLHSVVVDECKGPGFCFRLYTEDAFNNMASSAEPEIRRCSLTQSVLQLKCLGQDLEAMEFMDPPDVHSSTH